MTIFPEMTDFYTGDVVYEKGGVFGPRLQSELQLFYVYNAMVRFECDGRRYFCRGGEATVMIPGITYRLYFSSSEEVRHGWVDARRFQAPQEQCARIAACPEIFPFSLRMRQLADIVNGLADVREGSARTLYQVLSRGIFEEAFLQMGLTAEQRPQIPERLRRTERYMRDHLHTPLDLDVLTQQAGLSKTHFVRLFKTHYHRTPMQHLWWLRLGQGARLLRETGLTVAQVSERSGFQTPYHFSRLFRARYGLPPRAWRMAQWGQARSD